MVDKIKQIVIMCKALDLHIENLKNKLKRSLPSEHVPRNSTNWTELNWTDEKSLE